MCGLKGTQEHLDYVVCVHTLTVGWGREGVVVVVGGGGGGSGSGGDGSLISF